MIGVIMRTVVRRYFHLPRDGFLETSMASKSMSTSLSRSTWSSRIASNNCVPSSSGSGSRLKKYSEREAILRYLQRSQEFVGLTYEHATHPNAISAADGSQRGKSVRRGRRVPTVTKSKNDVKLLILARSTHTFFPNLFRGSPPKYNVFSCFRWWRFDS
jgi:hypothetical protein